MCGRYTLQELNAFLQIFAVETELDWEPRFNIAPSQSVAVIRNSVDTGMRELAMLRWGLVPSWADDIRIGNRLINARAETIDEKSSFKNALKSRRCVVLADGYYEWKKNGKRKQPYFIRMADERPFVFAGLWERWSKSQTTIESCTIITTTPNEVTAEIHDRMPVVLSNSSATTWLDAKAEDTFDLKSLLVPYTESEMVAIPVGSAVNSPLHDSPDCILPQRELF